MNSNGVLLFFAALLSISHADKVFACNDEINWIPLKAEDLHSQKWRSQSPTGFGYIQLDMNGNGVLDTAALVVSDDRRQSGIRICFDQGTNRDRLDDCHVVAVSDNVYEVMGVDRREPGCYPYNEDDSGNSPSEEACSVGDVLEYFRFGSSGSFFIYDMERRTFRRYWDSY